MIHLKGGRGLLDAAAAGVACTAASSRLGAFALLDAFVREARVHDLCVLDAEPNAHDLDRGLIEAVLLEGALPVLRAAEAVEPVSVVGGPGLERALPGADAAAHLARHGVPVAVATVAAPDGDVAASLRDRAEGFGADLLVLGAYERPRPSERLLGGVTRSSLKRSAVPVLLAH